MISNEHNSDAFLYEAEHGQIEEPDELSNISTIELVNELVKRGSIEYTIGDKCEYCITADYGEDVCVCAYGPCKILVVKDE